MSAAVFGLAEVERIVAFAKRYPVFPCGKDKRPLVRSGFHAASADPEQIRKWWTKWPDALVGVPTGQGTGLVVVDYDPDKATSATHEWISEHTELLCSTRTHKTPRGGLHYVFQSKDRYQTGVDLILDGSPRKGIDLRANGGYVIWWPFHTGEKVDGPLAPVPADLIDERRFNDRRDLAPLPTATPESWALERDRVEAALTHVSPDGYEQWIRIGMAIHAASNGSEEGFARWHEWSASGESYDGIEDCRYHWHSFGNYAGRAIGLGTLYSAAKATGFDLAKFALPTLDMTGMDDIPESDNKLLRAGFWIKDASTHVDLPYLVKGLFDRGQMIVLWGPPGSGKTFCALSMAAHIGAGKHWASRRVKRGKVLYVCAESTRKRLENRARALVNRFPELSDSELYLVPLTLDLLQGNEDILSVCAAAKALQDVALIVVDTLAVTFGGGDENSPEDMGRYVSNMKAIKDTTGAAVLIVHHCGKDEARGMRGHSSLLGALDGELAVERPDPKQPRIFKAGKLREGESFCDLFTFDLEVTELGVDPDGDLVTTCVVVPNGVGPVVRRPKPGVMLTLLQRLEDDAKKGSVAWTEKEVRELAADVMHRNSVRKAILGLVDAGYLVASVGGWALKNREEN